MTDPLTRVHSDGIAKPQRSKPATSRTSVAASAAQIIDLTDDVSNDSIDSATHDPVATLAKGAAGPQHPKYIHTVFIDRKRAGDEIFSIDQRVGLFSSIEAANRAVYATFFNHYELRDEDSELLRDAELKRDSQQILQSCMNVGKPSYTMAFYPQLLRTHFSVIEGAYTVTVDTWKWVGYHDYSIDGSHTTKGHITDIKLDDIYLTADRANEVAWAYIKRVKEESSHWREPSLEYKSGLLSANFKDEDETTTHVWVQGKTSS
ncbi:MAG: hypothetical protein MMC33_008485 [Icmadophila ericetorum]|nr:hypothetical protein [Icmadophila ericetorum]